MRSIGDDGRTARVRWRYIERHPEPPDGAVLSALEQEVFRWFETGPRSPQQIYQMLLPQGLSLEDGVPLSKLLHSSCYGGRFSVTGIEAGAGIAAITEF